MLSVLLKVMIRNAKCLEKGYGTYNSYGVMNKKIGDQNRFPSNRPLNFRKFMQRTLRKIMRKNRVRLIVFGL